MYYIPIKDAFVGGCNTDDTIDTSWIFQHKKIKKNHKKNFLDEFLGRDAWIRVSRSESDYQGNDIRRRRQYPGCYRIVQHVRNFLTRVKIIRERGRTILDEGKWYSVFRWSNRFSSWRVSWTVAEIHFSSGTDHLRETGTRITNCSALDRGAGVPNGFYGDLGNTIGIQPYIHSGSSGQRDGQLHLPLLYWHRDTTYVHTCVIFS